MPPVYGAQEYPWAQFYQLQGKSLADHLDPALAATAAAGLQAWEPFAPDESGAERLRRGLDRHGLRCVSVYANARLHTPDADRGVEEVLRRARIARDLGASVFVVNAEPVDWHDARRDKDDAGLRRQAETFRRLDEALGELGVRLAYHFHEPELRRAAREFHHMLLATRDRPMGLCLDAHWLYRGAGNSQVAVEDVLELYGSRTVSLHLRQSRNGVWTQTLGDGDLDYRPIARLLRAAGFSGPVILEPALEEGTPRSLPMQEALRRSLEWARSLLE